MTRRGGYATLSVALVPHLALDIPSVLVVKLDQSLEDLMPMRARLAVVLGVVVLGGGKRRRVDRSVPGAHRFQGLLYRRQLVRQPFPSKYLP